MRLLFSSTTSFRIIFSLILAMFLGETTTACGIFGQACTDVGCSSTSTSVAINDLPIDDPNRLPIAIDVCDATVCTAFIIIADGEEDPSGFLCTIGPGVRCCYPSGSNFPSCTIENNRSVNVEAAVEWDLYGVVHPISVVAADKDGATLISAIPIVYPGKPDYPNGENCDGDSPCYDPHATVKAGDL
jgi:hypothetical protein